jgi:hypothetical protein
MNTTKSTWHGVAILLAVIVAGNAQAQGVTTPPPGVAPGCLRSIPMNSMARVPVFASLAMRDSLRLEIPTTATNMLQAVANRIATSVGVRAGEIPEGEPGITWDSVGRPMAIVWHRNGTLTWRVFPDTNAAMPTPAKAALLFGRALDSAQARRETVMTWPDGVADDSLEMWVDFARPKIDGEGIIKPVRARAAVPVFSVVAPREEEVVVVQPPPSYYPPLLQAWGVEGRVMMEFAVDTTGRADPATIHDVWPKERPRLTGALGAHYQELVRTARHTILATRFAPGAVGGCKFRQVVQQPFSWDIAR